MLGAIIGDVVGSRFEWHNYKGKDFDLFDSKCKMTDDSTLTIAIAKAFLEAKEDYSDLSDLVVKYMREFALENPSAGYGGRFVRWMYSEDPKPYNSYGNGAPMRVSPVGFVANSIEECKELSKKVTEVTHNHLEGLKGAEAISVAIFLARQGKSKEEIKQYMEDNYYIVNGTVDEIRKIYKYDISTQGSVPPALQCFYESTDFEDCIRNAISIGGDSDTIGAIIGGVAEAYYGIPDNIKEDVLKYIKPEYREIIEKFEEKYQK